MIEYAYIHIPFCTNKCPYCAFISFVNLDYKKLYINALLDEIKKEYDNTPLKTLYLGGGTPSILEAEDIEKIIKSFIYKEKNEITIEVNPEHNSEEYFRTLKKIGINRISIGIQTFNNKILKEIKRNHTKQDAINCIKNANKAGFKNISIDLMYGLPNQTIKDLKEDIEFIKQLPISHISTYGLKIEEKTYFAKFTPKNLPSSDVQADMYEFICKKLEDYNHYEISNFAKSDDFISKHNINYWNVEPYYGFGVSASGFDGKMRYKNSENLKKFILNPLLKEEMIEADLLEETIYLGFRKKEGINTKFINNKFSIDFEEKYKNILEKYTKTGHIEKTNIGYKLTLKGVLISNYILCDFL